MMRRLVVALSLGPAVLAATLLAQASPLPGTWTLNQAKSRFDPGPPPKSQTIKFERVEDGFRFTTDTVAASGQTAHTVTMQKDDGTDAPVEGGTIPGMTRSLRRTGPRTYEHDDKVDGKPTTTRQLVISQDGRSMTVTVTATSADGREVHNLVVYDKQ